MPRAHDIHDVTTTGHLAAAGLQTEHLTSPHLHCGHCDYALECVDQDRQSGTWLGSFICPNCRNEYFYAYRWGRLVRKS
jgi:hypothetical protein